jgi:hypothetical protein
MYIVSTFEYSTYLELAITGLEKQGIKRENILAIPLDRRAEERKLFDTLHRSDGVSLFDGAAVLGTIFMVLGTIYGFVWEWGPIIWGLIGLAFGALIGFIFDFILTKRRDRIRRNVPEVATEVILLINCEERQIEMIEDILWEHQALNESFERIIH